jgi:ferredoxin
MRIADEAKQGIRYPRTGTGEDAYATSAIRMTYRNRALLDLAYQLPCTLKIPGVCEGGNGEPAHANLMQMGKGKSIKAHDCYYASACRACHRELDQGKNLSRDERTEVWMRGYIETQRLLWITGLIKVT